MRTILFLLLLVCSSAFADSINDKALIELASIMKTYENLESRSTQILYDRFEGNITDAERNLENSKLVVDFERLQVRADLVQDQLLDFSGAGDISSKDLHFALQLLNHFRDAESNLKMILSQDSDLIDESILYLDYEGNFDEDASLFYLTFEVGFSGLWDYKSE